MKETKNYKLKLVEMSDTFSTQPLNENMTAVDEALTAIDTAAGALDQRIKSLELHHIAAGTYSGNANGITISVGFTPKAVIIGGGGTNMIVGALPASAIDSRSIAYLTASGFTLTGTNNPYCYENRKYNYLALA